MMTRRHFRRWGALAPTQQQKKSKGQKKVGNLGERK